MWGETTQLVENSATEALESLKATSSNKKTGAQIYEEACKNNPDFSSMIAESVFKSYLSNLWKQDDSRIGKDSGTHGYYLKKDKSSMPDGEQDASSDERAPKETKKEIKHKKNEMLLYPILKNWLQTQGYRSDDTSLMKKMGKWGNPDITGILVDETLGSFDFEVITIEAKITVNNYQNDFFEAVSHKRFANRVYFAFSATEEQYKQTHEELRYYSELYGVGVLVVVEEKHYASYLDGKLKEIDPDLVDVYELFSAPFESRLKRWQKKYLSALGIYDRSTLYSWGDL